MDGLRSWQSPGSLQNVSQVAAETLLLFLPSLSLFFFFHSHLVTRVTMNIMNAILGQTFWVVYNNNPASLGPSLYAGSLNCEAKLSLDPISLSEQVVRVLCCCFFSWTVHVQHSRLYLRWFRAVATLESVVMPLKVLQATKTEVWQNVSSLNSTPRHVPILSLFLNFHKIKPEILKNSVFSFIIK